MLLQPRFKVTDSTVGAEGSAFDSSSPAANGDLDAAIASATTALLSAQHARGYWMFELEADTTIPSEYILMMHFMDEIDPQLEQKIGVYLRSRQNSDGGWPLYHGGDSDISCTVKAYYALKLIGERTGGATLTQARDWLLARGGAARANVFTRITLALFGQIPWRGVPFVPVEHMLLPRWFPFHISKISYWSRTVLVPLSILCSLKPKAANPRNIDCRELFCTDPELTTDYFPPVTGLARLFTAADRMGRRLEPLIPGWLRRRAIRKAGTWFIERLNGYNGLGAIFPAMVNAHEALAVLGYPADHPYRLQSREALRRLLVVGEASAYCQPCTSPVWDTALATLALLETGDPRVQPACVRGADWLVGQQLVDTPADWRESRPALRGGGWPFQLGNDYYPDIDDTPVVAWSLLSTDRDRYRQPARLAADWIDGMQSRNGGFASFDVDNTYYYLNKIPFADHGALLDPPTSDVTGRCLALLSMLDAEQYAGTTARALRFLKREQEADGSWFGRWGTNYIYGTWSVLSALEKRGEDPQQDYIQRAVMWLLDRQQADGGWGESNASYESDDPEAHRHPSTSFQTAWALLALMAAGQSRSTAVRRGIDYLVATQCSDGFWHDDSYTAPGFPRVFYLKYHGYTKYFPLWALASFRRRTGIPAASPEPSAST